MTQAKIQLKEWQRTRLGDFVILNYGKGLPERDRIAGSYPVYGSAGVVDTNKDYLVEGPGIIVGRKGSVGEIYYTDKNYFPIDTVYYITKSEKYNLRFLYYLLKTIDFKSLNSDAAVPGLNRNTAYAQEVLSPKIETQKQIANVLSAYDNLIENNTRRIKILEEIAQAIYREWFVYFRFPGHEKVKMIDSKTEFGKIPEGWEVKKIGDVFDVKYGKNLPTSKIKALGNYPVYGAGGVIGFYHEQNSDGKVALITCRGNGSGTVWRTRGLGFVTNNSFTVWPKEEYQYMDFTAIYFALKNANVDSAISGSAQPQITIESLNFVNVLLPEKSLLKSFQDIVKSHFNLIDSLFVENQNLRQARDLLLPKLVTGEVGVG